MMPKQSPLTGSETFILSHTNSLPLPSRWHASFEQGAVLRPNSNQPCVEVLSQPMWDVFVSKISGMIAKTDQRGLAWMQRELAKVVTVCLGPDGALDIPDSMAAHAELSSGASVVIVGSLDRLTVWRKQRWVDFQNGEEEDAAYVMEKYGHELFWPITS